MKNLTTEQLSAIAERFKVTPNSFTSGLTEDDMISTILFKIALDVIENNTGTIEIVEDMAVYAFGKTDSGRSASAIIRKANNAAQKALDWFDNNGFVAPSRLQFHLSWFYKDRLKTVASICLDAPRSDIDIDFINRYRK